MSVCLKLSCENGHFQIIRTEGMSREYVAEWGKLMDGSSPFYVKPVERDEDTFIGHCARCKAQTKSEVIDCEAGDQVAIAESDYSTALYSNDPKLKRQ